MTSLYELTHDWDNPTSIRFLCNFSGKELAECKIKKWDDVGTNTFAMADEIDGGFKITTGTASGNENGRLSANNKLQFRAWGCAMLSTVRKTSSADCRVRVGFGEDFLNNRNTAYTNIATDAAGGYVGLNVIEHTTLVQTATDVATSTNWVDSKLVLKPTTTELSIGKVLKATSTSTPLKNLEPNFYVLDLGTTDAKVGQIRYWEAWNT